MVPNEPAEVARAYVALCLRLGRLVPELVHGAVVDAELRRTVAAEPPRTAAALVREAGRLAEALPDAGLDADRERYLAGQLRAVEWRARRLAGQRVSFRDEVRACLGLEVVAGEPDAYRAAHRELDALLPGTGPLAARWAAHRTRDVVPPDRLAAAWRASASALRELVVPRFGLPADEGVALRVVDDGPWSALHTYCGGHRSVVRLNAGARPGATRLPQLVAHETYPGHHVECVRAELAAARRPELTVTVLGSPRTVLSEGLAECGLDTAVGAGRGDWAAGVLASAGVRIDGGRADRLADVRRALQRVRLDAAVLLHGDRVPDRDAAEAHLRRWLLLDAGRARRVCAALARPMWRTQVVASVLGADRVRELLGRPGVDPAVEHRRLLDGPWPPAADGGRTGTESRILIDRR